MNRKQREHEQWLYEHEQWLREQRKQRLARREYERVRFTYALDEIIREYKRGKR